MSLLTSTATPVSAAPAAQCNGEQNGGGTQVACTVVVNNYLTATGALSATPPSTVVSTRCVGASGPVSTLTCATTTVTSAEPVTSVQQCNGSGNGGGGTVRCTVTVSNTFAGAPAGPIVPATVYQCVGSVITGTGAPGTCTPANTPGVTSVGAATVGQCNGSGNGGTSVGFTCTVATASTTTTTLAVNVDQCNNSANGGGALTVCAATVSNVVIAAPPVVTPTPVVTPVAVPTPVVTPVAVPTAVVTPVAVPTPVVTPVPAPVVVPTPVVPRPAPTGNGGFAEERGTGVATWPIGLLVIGIAMFVVAARRLVLARANR